MATGHAYDSEGGRALAGAITSLMTGTAYEAKSEVGAAVAEGARDHRDSEREQRLVGLGSFADALELLGHEVHPSSGVDLLAGGGRRHGVRPPRSHRGEAGQAVADFYGVLDAAPRRMAVGHGREGLSQPASVVGRGLVTELAHARLVGDLAQ